MHRDGISGNYDCSISSTAVLQPRVSQDGESLGYCTGLGLGLGQFRVRVSVTGYEQQ